LRLRLLLRPRSAVSVREPAIRGTGQVGILGQIAAGLRAGLNAALAPAADPRTAYVSAHSKQRALLAQVGLAMNQVTASKERLQGRALEDRARLPRMLDEARAELVAGRADAARLCLRRRHVVALELEALEAQLAEVESDETNLRMLERRLANQVDEFVARQEVIVARYNAAEAQIQIKEAVTGVSNEFAELTAALAQAEQRTEGMEARASAIDRLVKEGLLEPLRLDSTGPGVGVGPADDDVDLQLAALERDIAGPS
jgi:phage shock protein A